MITEKDLVKYAKDENSQNAIPQFSEAEISECLNNAGVLLKTVYDREYLKKRGFLQRYTNILMGEISECAVLKWLESQKNKSRVCRG